MERLGAEKFKDLLGTIHMKPWFDEVHLRSGDVIKPHPVRRSFD